MTSTTTMMTMRKKKKTILPMLPALASKASGAATMISSIPVRAIPLANSNKFILATGPYIVLRPVTECEQKALHQDQKATAFTTPTTPSATAIITTTATTTTTVNNKTVNTAAATAGLSNGPEPLRCKKRTGLAKLGITEVKPLSVSRRNARERNRVKLVNQGFRTLREYIPDGKKNSKMSKVDTLKAAMDYIHGLERMIREHDEKMDISESATGSANNTGNSKDGQSSTENVCESVSADSAASVVCDSSSALMALPTSVASKEKLTFVDDECVSLKEEIDAINNNNNSIIIINNNNNNNNDNNNNTFINFNIRSNSYPFSQRLESGIVHTVLQVNNMKNEEGILPLDRNAQVNWQLNDELLNRMKNATNSAMDTSSPLVTTNTMTSPSTLMPTTSSTSNCNDSTHPTIAIVTMPVHQHPASLDSNQSNASEADLPNMTTVTPLDNHSNVFKADPEKRTPVTSQFVSPIINFPFGNRTVSTMISPGQCRTTRLATLQGLGSLSGQSLTIPAPSLRDVVSTTETAPRSPRVLQSPSLSSSSSSATESRPTLSLTNHHHHRRHNRHHHQHHRHHNRQLQFKQDKEKHLVMTSRIVQNSDFELMQTDSTDLSPVNDNVPMCLTTASSHPSFTNNIHHQQQQQQQQHGLQRQHQPKNEPHTYISNTSTIHNQPTDAGFVDNQSENTDLLRHDQSSISTAALSLCEDRALSLYGAQGLVAPGNASLMMSRCQADQVPSPSLSTSSSQTSDGSTESSQSLDSLDSLEESDLQVISDWLADICKTARDQQCFGQANDNSDFLAYNGNSL